MGATIEAPDGMSPHITSRRRVVTALGLGGLTLVGTGIAAGRGHERTFRTHLSGDNEVPPVDTNAQGQATFHLNTSGDGLGFTLLVANIDDVVAAHIHCAPVGENGPVGVTLFTGAPTSEHGILSEGTIAEPDDGNGCGWETLSDVVAAIRRGETYVNVHTVANTSGEIRGQIH